MEKSKILFLFINQEQSGHLKLTCVYFSRKGTTSKRFHSVTHTNTDLLNEIAGGALHLKLLLATKVLTMQFATSDEWKNMLTTLQCNCITASRIKLILY